MKKRKLRQRMTRAPADRATRSGFAVEFVRRVRHPSVLPLLIIAISLGIRMTRAPADRATRSGFAAEFVRRVRHPSVLPLLIIAISLGIRVYFAVTYHLNPDEGFNFLFAHQ